MKKLSLLTLFLTLMLLNGCLVKSLHPFYTEKDVIFNEELIGKWIDNDSTEWKIERSIHRSGPGGIDTLLLSSYVITFGEPVSIFRGNLFMLNNIYYLDFFPLTGELFDDEFYIHHLLPTHSLAKVEFLSGETVKISWFNETWLAELFEQKKIKISHELVTQEDQEVYVLTASTRELQKFITKYGDDPDIYQCDNNDGVCITLRKIR
ncbi:MAG: hypothetical protein ACFCUM_18355 [Bacteroidales bacterium]